MDFDPFAVVIEKVVPTTDAQREVWLAAELGVEASLAYNESVSLCVYGPVDAAALAAAVSEISARHESLRATVSADGMSLMIAAPGSVPVPLVDLSGRPEYEIEAAVQAVRKQAVREPFDMIAGPLFRATLLRRSPEHHELVLAAHHVICDGWSFGVISRELMQAYAAARTGRGPGWPAACSFGQYAFADADQERTAEADEKYWLGVYDGSVPALDLPVDRPRPARRSYASRREDRRLPPQLVEHLRRTTAQRGVSLFTALFGLFAGLLSRLTREPEVVIGVPSAGQAARGMPNLVGHCVNLLPVRVDVEQDWTAEQLLAHTHDRVLDAYEHQACTFGRLLSKLQLARDASRLPLVSVQFNLDSEIDPTQLAADGLDVSLHSNARDYENFELFLNVSQQAGALIFECQYSTDLFDRDTVAHWLALLETAAGRMAANPAQPVGALYAAGELDVEAYARLNDTALEYPRNRRAEALFVDQVVRTPDKVAVEAGGRRLTYRELDARANGVARALRDVGMRDGDLVGLCCGRDEGLIIGLLGILKAGAGYVPLDPHFPAERLAWMREDAALRLVVADATTVASSAVAGLTVVRVDDASAAAAWTPHGVGTNATAYVLFTSGSTGRPKGVMVSQRGLVSFLHAMLRAPGLRPDDRLVAVTTVSFDIAVLELLLPLITGATVIVADRDTVRDPTALRRLLDQSGATVMQATPSGWRVLLESGWQGGRHFRALIGGEPLPRDLAMALLDRTAELWNGYGPTETTVYSSNWLVPRQPTFISIGTPVANTVIDVLDDQLRLCAVGVPGEICIGGDGIANGYIGQPDLTAARFICDPRRPEQRLYRTGDRGRLRADGLLEHLGRLDHQVKVRGYRIELGDVEVNLMSSGVLSRCVAVVREDIAGDPRLVAYCVPATAEMPMVDMQETLRRHAAANLPYYMLPQHIEVIAAIPLLPNGKVNRKALPAPADAATGVGTHRSRPPSTAMEELVCTVMGSVLSVGVVGPEDDFFMLGGHSLLASRLVIILGRELRLALPLRAVFEHPTPAALARCIEALRAAGSSDEQPRIEASGANRGPLTLMQERIRFMEEMQPGRVVYNTPSAHRLMGPLNVAAFAGALERMIERQPVLRTVIAASGAGYEQVVLEHLPFELQVDDLGTVRAADREAELQRRLEAVIDQPIAIDSAPLFRARLYRLDAEEHVFLFMPHHIIWDGWSFDLLYEEMGELYAAELEGRVESLPVPPVTYLDYSRWHRQWLEGDECARQVEYWVRRFETAAAPTSLPTDFPRRAGMSGLGAVEWIRLDRELTDSLRAVAQAHGATLNMVALAVYAAMLSDALVGETIIVGMPVRGRLGEQVEHVMGFFNNLLPVPLSVRRDLPFPEWLTRVRVELTQAFAHQDVPFERMILERPIAARASAGGLYQSLFSFQDARERRRRWAGLSHSSVLVMQKGTTEDLGLWLMEVPGGIEGGINYNADLFTRETAVLFRDRFVGLLRRVVAAPEATLASLLHADDATGIAFRQWVTAARAQVLAVTAPRPSVAPAALVDGRVAALTAIWADILGIDAREIQPGDTFFDLGGNSLQVMQAVGRTELEMAVRVDPRRYVHETLAQLARTHEASPTADAFEVPASGTAKAATGLSRWLTRLGRKG